MKLGVLASGGGSNLQSLINAIGTGYLTAEIAVVISNNSRSGALERASRQGIPGIHMSSQTHPDPADLDRAVLAAFTEYGVEFVILAGYMKKLRSKTLSRYRNHVINIHPALLPDFGGKGMYGMHVHRAVIAAGRSESGPTVHLVDEVYDEGPVLSQASIPVKLGDTAEALQARVLEAEHLIYPQTLREISTGLIRIGDETPPVVIRPLRLDRDFESAAVCVRTSFAGEAAKFDLTRENCPTHPSFIDKARLKSLLETGGTFFGAFIGDSLIGTAAIEPSRDDPETWYIEKLCVLPGKRSTGFGSLLLDHACRGAVNFGAKNASIGIIGEDNELKSWYNRRGFTETGTRDFDHLPFTVCFMNRGLTR
ncbi:MAG: phosphoribosylglycinamide formyltransferase [Spirochaetales bacterium]|jgi:phosphoribosylglycinamide formyltransferase 1|nr:phosphoribosylglycinamide formyltransferase [Spirochaetales bacterium]